VRLARFNIQSATQDKKYFAGLPSPAAAGVPAATVFAYPAGLDETTPAMFALAVVIVPALLMVSTIRFRSFKTFDLQSRRSYPVLLLVALGIALLAAQPQVLLLALAYVYLSSAFLGMAWTRLRRRGHPHAGTAAADDRTSGDSRAG
jgi:CDP-diacylglycerol--serine O-phosphatidyltransferase